MINPIETDNLRLLEYVKALENKSDKMRGRQVQSILRSLGIDLTVQKNRLLGINNIVVDLGSGKAGKVLLFSAHFDAVKDSPGANDNASGVAVLLGLCQCLKNVRIPVRVIFFDAEEGWLKTRFIKLGIVGSLDYVMKNNLRNSAALYNLEFCGQGDFLNAWPVKKKEVNLPSVRVVEKAAGNLKISFKTCHVPWLFLSSDHLAFRFRGMANSITLSLLPTRQMAEVERVINDLSVLRLLTGRRPKLPEPLSFIHSPRDNSGQLGESSLQLMLAVLLEIVRTYEAAV